MMNTTIGIGELSVTKSPNTLTTLGLGSCVGLCLFDNMKKIGGMVHIMLPEAPKDRNIPNKGKYADTGFDELLRRMVFAGANPKGLVAKMAGGAHMFSSSMDNDIMRVGERNIALCRKILSDKNIPIISEETGGTTGRTIVFNCSTGQLTIRTAWPRTERTI